MVANAQSIKLDKKFISILEDNIKKEGAMDKLISNRVHVEIS